MSGDTIQEIDLVEVILETTNSLYSSIISSIVQNINPLLDKLIFVDNTITTDSYFEKILKSMITVIVQIILCKLSMMLIDIIILYHWCDIFSISICVKFSYKFQNYF